MGILGGFMVPHPPIILPEIGRGEEEKIRKTTESYKRVAEEIARLRPDTIVISSPHSVMYGDYFHISPGKRAVGDLGAFRAGQVCFDEGYDEAFTKELVRLADAEEFPAGFLGEKDPKLDHGTMIPLYFVRKAYREFRLVRIGLSGLPLPMHYRLGEMIRETAERLGRKIVFIASGDLSHKLKEDGPYGLSDEGPVYDDRIMRVMGSADFGKLFDFDESFCDKAAECGHRSFVMMAGAFDGMAVKAEALSHEGTFGVGYGICTFLPEGPDEGRHFLDLYEAKKREKIGMQRAGEDAYVRIARRALETYLLTGKVLRPEKEFPELFDAPEGRELFHSAAGAFVSLHKDGRLRGCIGTILPTKSCVAEELVRNAISAATADPRFDAVREDEIDSLEYSVDVLGRPEKISGPEELDVRRYGVIVSCGMRRGLLLPDLDGVDTVEEQIAIARKKGGIREGEPVELERFEVIRHH
ncbi:MAG: AmmeMemoRadiSam system protein A [Lachnospiraceae bacterium]|nr:AmmeMemoRadiSam system protein A [Lachnospiraceae bacterium]